MNWNITLSGVAILLISFLLFSLVVLVLTQSPTHEEKVKCYDRFSNEIKGLSCDETVYDSLILEESGDFLALIGFVFIGFCFLGVITILMGVTS